MFRALLAAIVICGVASLPSPAQEIPTAPLPPSVIFSTRNGRAFEQFVEDPVVIRQMTDALVIAVTGQPDLAKAWRSLVAPTDRVGIKIAASGGRYFASHRGIVEALVSGLELAGVPRTRVVVWDRDAEDLRAAGYRNRPGGYQVASIPPASGYDRAATCSAPVLGRLIWGDLLFQEKQTRRGRRVPEADQLSSTSHFASVLSRGGLTKIINVAVLSDEAGCGVAGALYNLTVPNVDNWRRFTQPEGAGAIPGVYADALIGPKVILHLMDGLLAQYAGGPRFDPNYAFAHDTIYTSKDPVALDAHAGRLIEGWRAAAKLPPLGQRAEWLESAAQMGLGNFAAERITVRAVEAK